MGWPGPILTDSGGYQVFSLARLGKVSEEGAFFRSHINGSEHFLTPELAVQYQERLGSDIMMVLDECPPSTSDRERTLVAMERTHRWAERCLKQWRRESGYLYGIVQGGVFPELRRDSAAAIASLDFSGIAIGGFSLGEPSRQMWDVVGETVSVLPAERPRYLMGVGAPDDIVKGVAIGIDLFDCALPTRVARNGALFTATGRRNIRNAEFCLKDGPVDPGCDCPTCRTFSAAYLHHLFKAEELLAYRLATLHNVRFIVRLLESARAAIREGRFKGFAAEFLGTYQPTNEEVRLAQKRSWLERQSTPVPESE
jgi:queuine tRNA-ribosyltransferase